jgi:hypothetical protein
MYTQKKCKSWEDNRNWTKNSTVPYFSHLKCKLYQLRILSRNYVGFLLKSNRLKMEGRLEVTGNANL